MPMGQRTRDLWDLLVNRGVSSHEIRAFYREYGNEPLFNQKPVRNLPHYAAAVNLAQAVKAQLAQPTLT